MVPAFPRWWERYCGAPYAFRGRDLATGIDCWGLYALVSREVFGLAVDDFGAAYAGDGEADPQDRRGLAAAGAAITANLSRWRCLGDSLAAWEEGAGVLLRTRGLPLHCGIATGTRGVLLHAYDATGVDLLDLRSNPKWSARLVGCYLPA